MNKYYINCCTGDKAIVEEQKSYLIHIKKPDNSVRTGGISEEDLHKFWIPVTKAEYESSLTLNEIKASREQLEDESIKSYCININTDKKAVIDVVDSEGNVWLTEKGTNHKKIVDSNTFTFEWLGITEKQFWDESFNISNAVHKVTIVHKDDKVNHPSHYTWLKDLCGIEVIDITRHLDFNTGNALKYILRAGHKHEKGMTDKAKHIQDLKKAIWYLNDEITMLDGQGNER